MIAAALKALAGWKGYAVAALAGALVAGSVAWTVQGWRYGAQIAGMERDQAQQIADAQALARAVEQRRWAAREGVINDAKTQSAAAAADAAGARAERDWMRKHANTLARAAAGRDPALADGSPAGAAAVDLLAYMLGRAVDRATALAGIADRARVAGLTCERAYESLR